ncbi:MAG: flagellar hook-length control protein FliK [bacterium]
MDPPIRVGPLAAPSAPASSTLAFDARIAAGSLTVGQQVGARLLSDRASGRFLAMIDGRQVEGVLPPGAKAGDTLRLTVIADQPRLVLSGQGERRAGPSAGTFTAVGSQAVATAAAGSEAASPSAGVASDVSLSAGGRALARLVADISAAAAGARGTGTHVIDDQAARAAPLVALPAAGRSELAGQLAGALARTFSGSGLFYESHQAQWVAGERSLDSLRQEPQGKLPPLPPAAAGRDLPGPQAGQPAGAGMADAGRMPPAGLREPAAAFQSSGALPQGAASPLAGVVDPASASLVQQQLATLDAGSAGWIGLALPGMPARIAVQERPGPSGEDEEAGREAAGDWSTTVSVTLPRLGAIDARLLLRGDRLMLSVAAGAATGADELAAARQQLLDALAAAGLKVDALQVEGP